MLFYFILLFFFWCGGVGGPAKVVFFFFCADNKSPITSSKNVFGEGYPELGVFEGNIVPYLMARQVVFHTESSPTRFDFRPWNSSTLAREPYTLHPKP